MPTYIFKCDECGRKEAVVRPVATRNEPAECPHCGDSMDRCIADEHRSFRNTPGNWPLLSDAMGVHPDQVSDAVAHSKQIGIPTDFTSGGRAVFRSAKHRRQYCTALGFRDRNAGYSDPQ